NERHERGRHRLGEPDARPAHHPHHRGTRAGLERREIGRPRAHPARDHHVAEPHAGMHVPGHDPEPGAAADPVHGGESEAEEHPSPTQVRETGEEPLQALAEEHQDEEDPAERDDGEQFEPGAALARRALTVSTGPSGSGKSSLAFDTLYAEGQRRYIESLSTYAKQFLERMPKPLVDSIDGISPAVAIEQKNPTTTSRSTVGTATEIYDFLRLLWARVGTPYCVKCGREVKADTVQEVVDALIAERGTRNAEQPPAPRPDFRVPRSDLLVAFPLPPSAHRPDVELAAQLRAAGFVRAQVDGALVRLDAPEAERRVREGAEVLVVVDRVAASAASRGRLTDAVATAFSEGEGVAVTLDNGDRRRFSERSEEHTSELQSR